MSNIGLFDKLIAGNSYCMTLCTYSVTVQQWYRVRTL